MFSSLKVRMNQGRQYVVDLRRASPVGFRGLPVISPTPCEAGCAACVTACPTQAIALDPVRIDLGKCTFCRECELVCPVSRLSFSTGFRMASATREGLVVKEGDGERAPVEVSAALKRLFGRSLKLRSVSSGGCNGCELELNASSNVNFDLSRYGIDFVASPRHADALVISGPLTKRMHEALERAWLGLPDPKFVVSFGACAISGGLYAGSAELERDFLSRFTPSLYVPGCPPHPLTFINGLMDLLGIA